MKHVNVLYRLICLSESKLQERFYETREVIDFLENNWKEIRVELINRGRLHLTRYGLNPEYSPSYFLGNDLKFHKALNYEMMLSLVESGKPSKFLSTLASDIIFLNIGDEPVSILTYKLPLGWTHDVFEPGVMLGCCEHHPLSRGSALFLDSGTHVPRICLPPKAPALLFKIVGTRLRNLVWNFSPESLRAQFTAASWVTGQRLKVAAKVLGAIEDDRNGEKVIPALLCILANENHDVRWAALESLCLLDEELGAKLLRCATSDPHPHIAATARRTIGRLGIA